MNSFETCVDILTRGERHRVWSLIVTVFGDLAQGTDDRISMQALTQITEPIGVKPEALRVALHRLKKEGWIDSIRRGRSSLYRLTDFGREQSTAAAPRIYRDTPLSGWNWHVVLASSTSVSSQREIEDIVLRCETVQLSGNAILADIGTLDIPKHVLCTPLKAEQIPAWVRSAILNEDFMASYKSLFQTFSNLEGNLPPSPGGTEAATLRTLIVHSWRRVLLRHPDVPDFLLPKNSQLPECRALFSALLNQLPKPTLEDLETD